MNDFIEALDETLLLNADPDIKIGKEAYMRNKFHFYGIITPKLKEISKPFFHKGYLPVKNEMDPIVRKLWSNPEREYQYFAQEFALKHVGNPEKTDIRLYEFMIVNKSWWDTVDFVAAKLIGSFFRHYPELKEPCVNSWILSGNIWLQRAAVIFQLKYKNQTDTALMAQTINSLLGSKEFFINKAIGWALREYSKSNPDWVIDFVENSDLSNLSRREALRLLQS